MFRTPIKRIIQIRQYPGPPTYNRFFRQALKMGNNTKQEPPLVWVDCEMTGLDHKADHIIEICCLLTDNDFNLIDQKGYEAVIHYSKEVMDKMSDWCIEHHGESGLTKKVIESNNTLANVENELLDYLKKYLPQGKGILAGNSIHQDRIFLIKEFPKIIDYLHYRQVDVSSIKEVAKRHNPKLLTNIPRKSNSHTARADILESIEELKWYTKNYFRGPAPPAALQKQQTSEVKKEV